MVCKRGKRIYIYVYNIRLRREDTGEWKRQLYMYRMSGDGIRERVKCFKEPKRRSH